jgi:hypothetical protein
LYPDFPGHEIEEVLLNWIDMGYAPENYSQAQLNELDSLTGSPTISETQTPQKHEGELVTLEQGSKSWKDDETVRIERHARASRRHRL